MKCTLIVLAALCLASCATPGGPPAVDMRPVGDGLKLIGFAIVGMSVVLALGSIIRPRP